MPYLFLACAFALNAAGNILLKLGAEKGVSLSSYSPVSLVANNWALVLGCVLFAANVVFYVLALRALPLSVGYPIMVVMSFLIVNGYAFFALHESITLLQVLGYLCIVGGLTLVVANAQ